jgi:hypothetical protein
MQAILADSGSRKVTCTRPHKKDLNTLKLEKWFTSYFQIRKSKLFHYFHCSRFLNPHERKKERRFSPIRVPKPKSFLILLRSLTIYEISWPGNTKLPNLQDLPCHRSRPRPMMITKPPNSTPKTYRPRENHSL